MARILIVEDNSTMREGMIQILSKEGHEIESAENGRIGVELFKETQPDFVITDIKMDEMDGLSVLEEIHRLSPETLVMLITAFGTIEVAVDAMKKGAFDFITKPFPPDLLRLKVKNALRLAKAKQENRFFRKETSKAFRDLIGASKAMKAVRDQIKQVAPSDSTVLITGESGTGKELVARAIHAQSHRHQDSFIKTDCAALAESLLESELFGHEKGAFTGALARKTGRFELADGGTLFLDEIGEISPQVQLKLLRVLQDRVIERVGSSKTVAVDVRVISATNKDLKKEVKEGRFREDLFYRLYVVPIELPPLRKRRKDIADLIEYFAERWRVQSGRDVSISSEALECLVAYDWPGNVRELENLVERVLVLSQNERVDRQDLPEEIAESGGKKNKKTNDLNALAGLGLDEALETLEKSMIQEALLETQGVKTKAAKKLGLKTSSLYYKMEKYGLMDFIG